MGASLPAWGGALLTKAKDAQVGTLVESETAVSYQSEFGTVPIQKDMLMWYSMDKEVDTLFKAGQKAKADGNELAAITLFGLSATKEPATQSRAQAEVDSLRRGRVDTVAAGGSIATADPANPNASLSPQEKIDRGKQMIEHGNTLNSAQHLDGGAGGAAAGGGSPGSRAIADGTALVAEGEKELKAIKDAELAEAERKRLEREATLKAAEATAKIEYVSQWTDEEKRSNAIAYGVFNLIILIALWQVAMKELPD